MRKILKKAVGILSAAAILVGGAGNIAMAKPYAEYPWVYEDFEADETIKATASNASVERFSPGVAGTKGAARISVTKDYGTAKFPFKIKSGTQYKVSAWVKMIGDVPQNKSLHFIFYMHQKLSDGSPAENASCFKDIVVSNVPYSNEEYVYVTTTFDYQGTGKLNGAEVPTCDGDATVELRLGDGKLSTTNGSVIDYLLDDLIVEPVMQESEETVKDTSIGVKNGNFEYGFDTSVWKKTNCDVSVIDGANGTKNGVMITSTGNYGQISQAVPIEFNKAYRISLYAKAGDAATEGKELKLIIDRKDGKTDTSITSNYEYLPSKAISSEPSSLILTDSWQKIEFIYKNSLATFETAKPHIYPRVGSGTAMEVYCIDEFEIEELPDIVYNGDFSKGTDGWRSDGTLAELSDDTPSGSGNSMKITENANFGIFSQGINVQPDHQYRISFWAKGETWKNTDLEQQELYPVMDRYALNSSDDEFYENLTNDLGEAEALTKEWKYYEYTYDCRSTGDKYRVPLFYLQVANGKQRAVYYLYNVAVEDITPQDEPKPDEKDITDMTFDGKGVEGNPIRISYRVSGTDAPDGIVKLMKTYKNGYVSVGSKRLDGSEVEYIPTSEDVGSTLMATAILIEDEAAAVVKSMTIDEIKNALNIKPVFLSDISDETINARVEINNNYRDIDITAVIALFDENNTMTAMKEYSLTSLFEARDYLDLSIENSYTAKTAKLFVWEGKTAAETTMNSLTENISIQ